MLINITNHPSSQWGESQMNAAISEFTEVVDYPFPVVDPSWSEEEIRNKAKCVFVDIFQQYDIENLTVHIMGEFTLCYQLITLFKNADIPCIASTTRRIVEEHPDGSKVSKFEFVKFRRY